MGSDKGGLVRGGKNSSGEQQADDPITRMQTLPHCNVHNSYNAACLACVHKMYTGEDVNWGPLPEHLRKEGE